MKDKTAKSSSALPRKLRMFYDDYGTCRATGDNSSTFRSSLQKHLSTSEFSDEITLAPFGCRDLGCDQRSDDGNDHRQHTQ